MRKIKGGAWLSHVHKTEVTSFSEHLLSVVYTMFNTLFPTDLHWMIHTIYTL